MIMLMEQFFSIVTLGLFGLILGSYAAATVWRLRARQLVEDKAAGEKVDTKEYKKLLPLTKASLSTDRSRCLHCSHALAWYDLLPLVSWLTLRGKCRYCRTPIGYFEPIMELVVAAVFIGSYVLWPLPLETLLQYGQLLVWLVAVVMLAILFAYDLKWFLLPDQVVFPLIGVGVVMAVLTIIAAPSVIEAVISLAIAIAILSGIYLLLWIVSKGQWIGFGDVKLGLALALLLGNWQAAFIALFAANLIGCLVVIPGMIGGAITRTTRVPFGPLLIIGCLVALLWGAQISDWYSGLTTI